MFATCRAARENGLPDSDRRGLRKWRLAASEPLLNLTVGYRYPLGGLCLSWGRLQFILLDDFGSLVAVDSAYFERSALSIPQQWSAWPLEGLGWAEPEASSRAATFYVGPSGSLGEFRQAFIEGEGEAGWPYFRRDLAASEPNIPLPEAKPLAFDRDRMPSQIADVLDALLSRDFHYWSVGGQGDNVTVILDGRVSRIVVLGRRGTWTAQIGPAKAPSDTGVRRLTPTYSRSTWDRYFGVDATSSENEDLADWLVSFAYDSRISTADQLELARIERAESGHVPGIYT